MARLHINSKQNGNILNRMIIDSIGRFLVIGGRRLETSRYVDLWSPILVFELTMPVVTFGLRIKPEPVQGQSCTEMVEKPVFGPDAQVHETSGVITNAQGESLPMETSNPPVCEMIIERQAKKRHGDIRFGGDLMIKVQVAQ